MRLGRALQVALSLAAPMTAWSQAPSRPDTTHPSIAARTAGLARHDGLLPIYYDPSRGNLMLEIPRDSTRLLLFVGLASGLGSNPVGLDRGATVGEFVARFDRSGDRVLLGLENWSYRSSAPGNAALARSVAESFPRSTVLSLPIVAQEQGRLLVDASDLLYRDWADVAGAMAQAKQGSYALVRDRSSVFASATKAFPRNTELDAAVTFALTNGQPGEIASTILPDGRAFTLRQHLSFVALPDDGYQPRTLDPRVGYFAVTFNDYAQPIQSALMQRWITRHRLQRVNADDPNSPIANPIVYYIDRAIPEPIRTATKEGVSWWVEAFRRAGLPGAFVVEDLPDSVDPMDARYNVVIWENRNERGWSIGGSFGDPRTGEILKALARMDSHRARTDYNLYAGLMGADASASDTAFVLARVRQVSAHEVGHTLGLAHNYIASTYERGSVMDYPPPRVRLDASGRIDISAAYAVGPGAYDIWAIRWGYGIFPKAHEMDSLRAIVAEGLRKGYLFLSDADARPEDASDPRTNLWDDGSSAEEFFSRQMAVRRVALAHFNERNIRTGEPVALLQERFVPVYLMHRFAISALARTIGGLEYSNAMRGDAQPATRAIPGAQQRRALHLLLGALQPAELAVPDTVVALLAPRPYSYEPSPELFGSRTRPAFDELGAARTLAQMVVDAILQRERAARLVAFGTREKGALGLSETIDSVVAQTWDRPMPSDPHLAALQRVAQRALADRLLLLASDQEASPDVRAMAEFKISRLRSSAAARAQRAGPDASRAQWMAISGDFGRWLERRELPAPTPALRPPPGDPIGDAQ
ncbi:MAG TPA: zinc-dependent metalloprotease [Gemmatimonadaceae bacterium]|nr:zinc-dependent metalloprotease [Gemmatimonadaceae bacterium]